MKKSTTKKSMISLFAVLLSLLILAGCTPGGAPDGSGTEGSVPVAPPVSSEPVDTGGDANRIFIDSVGREIELPAALVRIAPSGTLADIILFTAIPDRLNGISTAFSKSQLKMINSKYGELPVFGKFYGKGPDYNLESVLAADTQVIVDIGEPKESITQDMDDLMNQIKVPTIFIEALFANLPGTYRTIGKLVGDSSRTDLLAAYLDDVLALSEKAKSEIPEEDRVRIYWAMGDLGLNTNAASSFHAELLDYVPLINVADIEAAQRGGGSEVSMEQVLTWDPDYILIDDYNLMEEMKKDPAWMALSAMREGRYVVIPSQPYGFLANPPSVNRIAGLQWLGNIFYPSVYTTDKMDAVREFYELFYGITVNDADLEAIMEGTFE